MEEQDSANVKLFPPAVPIAIILVGVALNSRVSFPLPLTNLFGFPSSTQSQIGFVIIVFSVLLLGLWPVIMFRNGGQSENPWKPTTAVVKKGPYKITRNPMYLQMILVCIGFSIALSNSWILLLTPIGAWALLTWVIKPEEAYLERKFGEEYRNYKNAVRRWL